MQLVLDFPPCPGAPWKGFIPGTANQEALSWLRSWPHWSNYGLVLQGPPSSGKTHLGRLWQEIAGARLLTREDQATPPTSLGDQPILIDGISGESWEETWFFHFLNARKHLSAGLLILDRQAPAAWPFATKDVISRCRALPLISIAEPDEALVAALLLALFHKRGITISSEVVQFLSLRLERTYTAILRAIELLDAQSLQSGRPLTVPFLREMEGILP